MTNEWPFFLAPGDKIVPIIAFRRRFLDEFLPRSSWLTQETSEILPSDGVICAWMFSDTLDISKSYALGSLATVFQTEVYAILDRSNYCRSANMHNMTICICSDSKAALLALSSYTISSKLLHQYWLSLQDLSNDNRVRLFLVPGHCDIKGNEEVDRLAKMCSNSHFCG
jgi:ribonuclease HI